jgi:protein gp37
MSQTTSIEWTDVSWNPVHGCSKVSPGCAHCYAETLSRRYKQTPAAWTPANAEQNVILKPHKLGEPLKWKTPRMVFVNSMSDLFHELVPDEFICRVFDVMRACQAGVGLGVGHTFQVLTKRPERMRDVCRRLRFNGDGAGRVWLAADADDRDGYALMGGLPGCRPLPNVWLGVSIENRRFVHRADVLRETPAAVRFISAEPLLGPLVCDSQTYEPYWTDGYKGPELDLRKIDWLIVGGESGPGARPMRLEWVWDLLAYNEAVSNDLPSDRAAFFVKQLGGARPGTKLEDLPEDLRIREFPAVVA